MVLMRGSCTGTLAPSCTGFTDSSSSDLSKDLVGETAPLSKSISRGASRDGWLLFLRNIVEVDFASSVSFQADAANGFDFQKPQSDDFCR
jgi:hypothetical protein